MLCFKSFGSFAALMTGNTVKLALAPFEKDENSSAVDSAYYASILASYIFGVWLFQWAKVFRPNRPGWVASPLCLIIFVLVDVLFIPTDDSKWRVVLLAPCFG